MRNNDENANQFYLALVIVIGFLILCGMLFFIENPNDIAKIIVSGFVGWIGAIIGFYYGQRPIREELLQKTRAKTDSIEINEKLISEFRKAIEEIEKKIEG